MSDLKESGGRNCVMNTQVKKRSLAGTILKTILLILLIVVAAAAALIGYLTATEYYPKAGEQETVPVMHENDSVLTGSGPLRIMTWNVGYGALGDNADFFMDGGSGVNTATKDRVQENVSSMLDVIERENPDILFLQEVDLNSMRSHHIHSLSDTADRDCEQRHCDTFFLASDPSPAGGAALPVLMADPCREPEEMCTDLQDTGTRLQRTGPGQSPSGSL